MAQNLNYWDTLKTPNLVGASWCGGGESGTTNEGDCSIYGRLYTWVAAIDRSKSECGNGHECGLNGPVQGICPDGWLLPSKDKFEMLLSYIGENGAGTKLKSTSGWEYAGNGSDAYGFSAIPAGGGSKDVNFYGVGYSALFLTSSEYDSENFIAMALYTDVAKVAWDFNGKDFGTSVRCLKNN